MSLARNRDDENDQQHQHHIDQRGHVDIRIGLTVVAADCHGHVALLSVATKGPIERGETVMTPCARQLDLELSL